MTERAALDVVVVGAGQAGLGIAYYLQQAGQAFVVFEQDRVGETWRSQRWDSFTLNTPNSLNGLPGAPYDGATPDEFWRTDELVASFERYVERFSLPVETGVTVREVRRTDDDRFEVRYDDAEGDRSVVARSVVIASGMLRSPSIPRVGADLPGWLTQQHAGNYRNPEALPDGAVLVVGSGQSGCQIAEDLLGAGRSVYLCTSKVARVPRRYRGRDILRWFVDTGYFDVRLEDLPDPAITRAAQPQVSGVGQYGHTVSLQGLAAQGVTLLGRAERVEGDVLHLDDSLAEHVRFADEKSEEFKRMIDDFIAAEALDLPPAEIEEVDQPWLEVAATEPVRELDLRAADVRTVIWCTGFTADFSWIDAPTSEPGGHPIHERGVSPVPGLYYLGFPWLASRKSGIVHGIGEDSAYIAERIAQRSAALS